MASFKKTEAGHLDEKEAAFFSNFLNASSSVTALYSQQKEYMDVAFKEGQRQAFRTMYSWIHNAGQQEGSITSAEILYSLHEELYQREEMVKSNSADNQNQMYLRLKQPHLPNEEAFGTTDTQNPIHSSPKKQQRRRSVKYSVRGPTNTWPTLSGGTGLIDGHDHSRRTGSNSTLRQIALDSNHISDEQNEFLTCYHENNNEHEEMDMN